MNIYEERLKEMGITLPAKGPRSVGNYAAWTVSLNHIYTSGQLPWKDGKYGDFAYKGRVGKDLTILQGYECAQICAINAITQLKAATEGDLGKIKQIVRIDGHVQAADGFKEHSEVLNGASDVFNKVFGKNGLHTRSALGIHQTPLDAPVLVYVIAEI